MALVWWGLAGLIVAGGLRGQETKPEERVERYEGGAVWLRYEVDATGAKNGEFVEHAPDGTVLVKASYAGDQLHGRYESFHPSGKRKIVGSYREGKKHGRFLELRDDGSRVVEAGWRNGELDGDYRSWHPGGKRHVFATYREGKLHGPYEEGDVEGRRAYTATYREGLAHGPAKLRIDGKVALTQTWKDGVLLELNGFAPHPVPADELLDRVGKLMHPPPADDGSAPEGIEAQRALALGRLKAYRSLCGVPYKDLVLDRELNDLCDAASEVCERLGGITHHPPDPGGLPPGRYDKGKLAAASSNLAMASSLPETVDMYMDDSDPSNIDALGHRRWCLNPIMRKTGFGWSNRFSAMWTTDRSGQIPKDLEAVAYPPAGYCPANMFGAHYAWSVYFVKGAFPAAPELQVTLVALDERYLPAGEPIPTKTWMAGRGGGSSRYVAFLPQPVEVVPGRRYHVRLSLDGGKTTRLEYVVEFTEPVAR